MDLVKVGFFNTPGSTGNFDVTDVGFEPSAVYFFQINITDNVTLAHAHGAADASGNMWATSTTATGRASQYRNASNAHCFYRTSTSATLNVVGTLTTMLSNGFRLNFTTVGSVQWGYIAFNKKVNTKVGVFTGAAGSNNITGIGFKPNGMITSWLTYGSTTIAQALGFVGTDLSQFGFTGGQNTGTASYNVQSTTDAFLVGSTDTSGVGRVTSWNSDGFTYNMSVGSGFDHGYLVFGGQLTAKVGQLTAPTSGNTTTVSGLGFDVQGLMTFPNINSVTTYGYPIGLGVSDKNLNQGFTGTGGYSGSTNNMTRYGSTSHGIGRTGYGVPGISYLGALTSLGTGSFTFNNALSSGGGETWQYFAFGWNFTDKTQTGKARIGAITSRTQTGTTRIQTTTTRNQDGSIRIQKDITQDIAGLLRVQGEVLQDQTGVVSILSNVRQEQTGIVSIAIDAFKDILGQVRISQISDRDQEGLVRIQKDIERPQTGLARIQDFFTRTIFGKVRVQATIDVDQNGKVRIGLISHRHQGGIVKIINRVVFAGGLKPKYVQLGELEGVSTDSGIMKKTFEKSGILTQVNVDQPGIYKPKSNNTGELR